MIILDGRKIVYATFNDSQVQEVRWKIYGNPEDAIVDPYPKEGTMRYPKVKSIFSFLSTDQLFWDKEAIL